MNLAAIAAPRPLSCQSSLTLGMAHQAPSGLSEDWWLKHLGDVHWQLIAEAVGQSTTVFRDSHGRQLYAAFCATEFEQLRPDLVGLGQNVELRSDLWAAGRSRIQSNHHILANGTEIARFKLISTFVAHMQTGVNASVRRATPFLMPGLAPAPGSFGQSASAQAKTPRQPGLNTENHISMPTHFGMDFNAVGLLYFPSFTRLLDQSEMALAPRSSWSPVKHRRVLYFGNIEAGESVLGSASQTACDTFTLHQQGKAAGHHTLLARGCVTRF
jgi:probable biosynthetic protein (TIGR04099 family)